MIGTGKTTGIVLDVADQRGGAMPGIVTLHDHSRFGNDGAFPGAGANPTWVQLPSGLWVMSFDGDDDYINIPNHPSLIIGTNDFTVKTWASLVALPTDAAPCMVTKGIAGAGEWMLRFDVASTRIGFYADAGAINLFDAGATDIRGAGYQYVVMCRRGTTAYLYLNAVQIGTQAAVGAVDLDTAMDLRLSAGVAVRDWHGTIALTCIYTYALTPAQIRAHYAATRRFFS